MALLFYYLSSPNHFRRNTSSKYFLNLLRWDNNISMYYLFAIALMPKNKIFWHKYIIWESYLILCPKQFWNCSAGEFSRFNFKNNLFMLYVHITFWDIFLPRFDKINCPASSNWLYGKQKLAVPIIRKWLQAAKIVTE